MKWDLHIEYLCKKAYKKLWVLRRLKVLDVDPLFMADVYQKEVRSILELAVPAWHPGLTVKLSTELERVQKVAVSIILGKSVTYSFGMSLLNLDPLTKRRENLCKKFAKKTLNSKHAEIFERNNCPQLTRYMQKFQHPICHTRRFYKSPDN